MRSHALPVRFREFPVRLPALPVRVRSFPCFLLREMSAKSLSRIDKLNEGRRQTAKFPCSREFPFVRRP